ncbi:WD repeat-containing and planar cell polarity effector protein fritz homolog, partial [Tachysurus ichikawai]
MTSTGNTCVMGIPLLITTGREETFLIVTPILFDWTTVVDCTSAAISSSSGKHDSSGLSINRVLPEGAMLLGSAVLVILTLSGVQLERVVIDKSLVGRLPDTISHGFVKSCCVMKSRSGAWQIIQRCLSTATMWLICLGMMLGAATNVFEVMRSEEVAVKWLTCFCITFVIVVVFCTVLL